jgi:hypothetical protein
MGSMIPLQTPPKQRENPTEDKRKTISGKPTTLAIAESHGQITIKRGTNTAEKRNQHRREYFHNHKNN